MVNPSPGSVFASRLRDVRALRRLGRNELAVLVADLGVPMSAQVIKKIEQGGRRAENVSLVELLAFAAALNVGPVHLLAPNDDAAAVAYPIGRPIEAAHLRGWLRGLVPLNPEGWAEFARSWPGSELKRGLRLGTRPGIVVRPTRSASGALEGGFGDVPVVDDELSGGAGFTESEEAVEDGVADLDFEDVRLGHVPEPEWEIPENIYEEGIDG